MAPLPYYVPQYGAALASRTVRAYVMRGLSYWLTNCKNVTLNPLDLVFVMGVRKEIALGFTIDLDAGHALPVLESFVLACKPWRHRGNMDSLLWALSVLRHHTTSQEEFEAVLAKAYFYHQCMYQRDRDSRRFDMKEDDASKIPDDVYNRMNVILADLQQTLLAKDPMMPQHLRTIHGLIISYPEAAHLLKDEEIALIIAGAQEHTKVQIVSEAAKKATAPRAKSLKNVSVSDL